MPKLNNFIGQAYTSRSRAIDSQLCKNLYPEIQQPSSKNVIALIGRPGLLEFLEETTPNFIGRGMYYSAASNQLYCAIGNILFKIDSGLGRTDLGVLTSQYDPVRFAENANNELLVVDGTYGYIVRTDTDAFTQLPRTGASAGFPYNCTHAAFIGGYFIVNDGATGNFYWSDQDDGLTWDALNFSNAEGSPDSLKGLIANRNELWLIGSASYEVWYLTDALDDSNRFAVIPGTLRNRGTESPDSIVQIRDHCFWVGSGQEGNGVVWMSNGYETTQISTPAIEYDLGTYTDLSDAVGFTYQLENHVFYVISFPTDDKTWVFDLNTGMWHQWTYYDSSTSREERALCVYQSYYKGKNYVLSRLNGKMFELDMETYTDDGEYIQRVRSSPHLHNDRKNIIYDEFEVDLERGTGLITGQGNDPQIMLEISNDGGYTFGNQLWTTIGKIGKYETRAHWHQLGISRDRVFKVTISDPVKVILIAANIQARITAV